MSGSTTPIQPFNVIVDQWVDKAKSNLQAVFAGTVLDIVARLQELTPVRTGYLRANWTVVATDDATPITSQTAGADLSFAITDLKIGVRAVITNPVKYAARINFGYVGPDKLGRHYHQEGRHMVEQTISEIPQIVKAVIARVNTGTGGDGPGGVGSSQDIR